MTSLIGVNRFLMIVRINDLMAYSNNHTEILDPFDDNISGKISRKIGTLSLPDKDNISDYDLYILDKNLKMVKVSPLFVLENKQFLILLSKLIDFPDNCFNIVNKRVIDYLRTNSEKFLDSVQESAYQNIKFQDFLFDPFP